MSLLGVLPWLVWEVLQDGPRWEKYKVEHACRMYYASGTWGPPNEPSGNELWVCTQPSYRSIIKHPHYPGVAGQI